MGMGLVYSTCLIQRTPQEHHREIGIAPVWTTVMLEYYSCVYCVHLYLTHGISNVSSNKGV